MRLTCTTGRLELFKRHWPCHNISDAVASVIFEYDARNNDLTDIVTLGESGKPVDAGEDSGIALGYLAQDIFKEATGEEQ
jgi:hypothetical protein